MKKQRKKKFNPFKHLQITANQVLKNYAIGFITGNKASDFINIKHNKVAYVNETTVKLITDFSHKWSVYIACFGIDQNNKKYMKSNEVHISEPMLQADIVETLNKLHEELCSNFNKSHMVSAGWIATPYYKEWDENKAFEILSSLGAFEYKQSKD